jgi:trimethylamine---corrinoid protein Co-methyltransferase
MTRPGGRARRIVSAIRQLPFQHLVNRYAPIEILSLDQVDTIIAAALGILERQGMRFLEAGSRQLLKAAGAECDEASQMVRFDRALVLEKLALAPAEFRLRARNPARDLTIGGKHVVFCSVGGPAFCTDLDRGRRPGTHAEVCDFLKLVQSLNIIHQESGGPFEAMDLPPETRHLDLYLAQLTLLDKNCQANGLGGGRTEASPTASRARRWRRTHWSWRSSTPIRRCSLISR